MSVSAKQRLNLLIKYTGCVIQKSKLASFQSLSIRLDRNHRHLRPSPLSHSASDSLNTFQLPVPLSLTASLLCCSNPLAAKTLEKRKALNLQNQPLDYFTCDLQTDTYSKFSKATHTDSEDILSAHDSSHRGLLIVYSLLILVVYAKRTGFSHNMCL